MSLRSDKTKAEDNRGQPLFDAISDPQPTPPATSAARKREPGEPFLGIEFQCCRQYARIYKNNEGIAYQGRCPRCGVLVEVPIGSGGTGNRFFRTN